MNGKNEDPRSWEYPREYVRPVIPWKKIVLYIALFLLVSSAAFKAGFLIWGLQGGLTSGLSVGFGLIGWNLKKILICSVKIYQRFAPVEIRRMCCFEPSCSNYMIGCIQKYGAFRGTYKGVNRLYRCSHGEGGYDFP